MKTLTMKIVAYIVSSLLILLCACSGSSGGSSDPCGNDIGNGNTIISGPAAADGVNNFDSPFRSLTIHPTNPDIVYLGTEENGILRSQDGGANWQRLRMGLRHSTTAYPEIYDLAISTSNPDVLIAATSAGPGLASGSDGSSIAGIYKSVDGGNSWQRKNCGLPTAAANAAYISPLDENIMLVGLGGGNSTISGSSSFFPGGVFRSTDAGENWSPITLATNEDENVFNQLTARGNNDIYTFGLNRDNLTNSIGFFNSTNSGTSFSFISTPFTNLLMSYFSVSADGQRITFIEQDQFKLNISNDAGATWSEIRLGSANGPVKISPHDKDHILFASNNQLWFSDDGLTTATQVIASAIDFFHDIEFSPSDPLVVYAVSRGYDFYRSNDGGLSFSKLLNLRTDVINIIP